MERYYRRKELKEQEQLRQQQQYMRYLRHLERQKEDYQRSQAAAIHHRQEAEEEYNRQKLRKFRYNDHKYSNDDEKDTTRIVQDPHGRLYFIKKSNNKPQVTNTSKSIEEENFVKDQQRLVPNRTLQSVFLDIENKEPKNELLPVDPLKDCASSIPLIHPKKRNKKSKKRVTVLVEDASESEGEDEFDSICRNRRPSPGEWMEPVKAFENCNIHFVS